MGNSIIIVKNKERIITCLAGEKELLTIQVDRENNSRLVGNIYLGKVKNIVKNINAAFVEISDRQICYLPLGEVRKPVFADGKEHAVRIGDELIVQVVKDATKTKAPLVTADFSLTGKNIVLVSGSDRIGVSSKIADEEKRSNLKALTEQFRGDGFGFVVRTNAASVSEETLISETKRICGEYERIVNNAHTRSCFTRLYSAPPSFIWEIRDGYSEEIDVIKTDDDEIYAQIKDYMERMNDRDLDKLVLYDDKTVSLSTLYNIESQLEKALYERVWMDSGAYLVIQPTEALVAIDVNTGKSIAGRQDVEETFFKVNCEAAEEIGRQIRLRNLSGIIIVDFIDMKSEDHKSRLIKKLKSVLEKDRIPTHVADMTALNLVEITRKKIRRPLYDQIENDK